MKWVLLSFLQLNFHSIRMGNDVVNVVEGFPSAQAIKVHGQTCSELLKLLIMVSNIFPEIEAARPRCSTGIDALCALNNGIVRAKSLLKHCSESSVLYLALTGDAIVFRCKKSRNLLEQSLAKIQNMVPIILAAKISGIITDLRSASFHLDPAEEEAGKVLQQLLHRYASRPDSSEDVVISAVQSVFSWLHITSQKALLTEKRSIRKFIDEIGESEPNKRKILLFLLNLLNKYGKYILKEQKDDVPAEHEDPLHHRFDEAQVNVFNIPVPPKEFLCPLTSRLMYDPVDIASGHTYERMWIKKWLDEGNDTCPKTKTKLAHLSLTSNTGMKDLILKWCTTNGVPVHDPESQEVEIKSWDTSSNSIASLSSSMLDLNFPLDFRIPSSGSSHGSYASGARIHNRVSSSQELDMEFFTKFSSLPWHSQRNVIKDVKQLLESDTWPMMPLENFIQLLLEFLKNSHEVQDVDAQMSGCLLLLKLLQKNSNSIVYMKEDAYGVLASFLDTDVAKQALCVLEILSLDQQSGYKFAASGALAGILNILGVWTSQELVELVLKILSNLSSNSDLASIIVPSDFIPKIIPVFEDSSLARYGLIILKNLCDAEAIQVSIAKTNGCISAIAKQLENDSCDDQEYAVTILLSLCRRRVFFRQLVVNEGIIPDIASLSINGNERTKAMAKEILQILGSSGVENLGTEILTDAIKKPDKEKDHPSKPPGLCRKIFSKLKCFGIKEKSTL